MASEFIVAALCLFFSVAVRVGTVAVFGLVPSS